MSVARLHIERLGQRGEGIALGKDGPIYVPYALAGETVLADVEGERGELVEILAASPDRSPAICKYYGSCGGCAVQTLSPSAYAEWKRGLLLNALRHAGLPSEVGMLVDAHGEGRRRVTFHARYDSEGQALVGFMKARAHAVVVLDACPVLAPAMAEALPAAKAIASALSGLRKPLDILVTATQTGLDMDVKGCGALASPFVEAVLRAAEAKDLARLSNHGVRVIERRAPILSMGKAEVSPPAGAFLQATEKCEVALASAVQSAFAGAHHALDLFAGVGTFALRLAGEMRVHAVDADDAALAALLKAARTQRDLRPLSAEKRDLFQRPLSGAELDGYHAVVFDPPRSGAEAQARALAASSVSRVAAVSCNPATFSRDIAVLLAGGYSIESITPYDQFRYSPHLEIIALLRRPEKKPRKARPLLG